MDYDTYSIESLSLTGVQYHYNNILPTLVSGEHTLNLESPLKPYVNLGIGTMYDIRTTDMGLWRVEERAWHFALTPEIGFLYELNPAAALKLCGKYYVGFAAGGLETQSYFALSAGSAFMLQ
jgi:outer membrane protein